MILCLVNNFYVDLGFFLLDFTFQNDPGPFEEEQAQSLHNPLQLSCGYFPHDTDYFKGGVKEKSTYTAVQT